MIRSTTIAVLLFALGASAAVAQVAEGAAAEVTVSQESLLAAPGGARIGQLSAGAPLTVVSVRDNGWSEVAVEAYVPSARVREAARGAFSHDLASGGADLHDRPDGSTIGNGLGGMLIERLSDAGGWSRIRREAWVRTVAIGPRETVAAEETDTEPPAEEGEADDAEPLGDRAEPEEEEEVTRRLVILDRPGGDTVAVLYQPRSAHVSDRSGEWARLQIDGWTSGDVSGTSGAAERLAPGEVRAHPERFAGRGVQWSVQYLSMRQSDGNRADIEIGEWFVLARNPDGEPGMVYLVVDEEQRRILRGFAPLQRFTVSGTVRTGRSGQTGHPVIQVTRVHQ